MNVCLNNALGNHNDNITCVVFVAAAAATATPAYDGGMSTG